jgi:hypothetical protein
VAFAAALERIVFAERVGGEFLGHHEAAEVGMALEADAEQIPDFALEPVRALPERHDARHHGIGVVDEHADGEPLVRGGVPEQIHKAVAVLRALVVEIVDTRDVDEQVEAELLEKPERVAGVDGPDLDPRLAAEDRLVHVAKPLGERGDDVINGGRREGHEVGGRMGGDQERTAGSAAAASSRCSTGLREASSESGAAISTRARLRA